jgi:hypothetical protein
MIPQYSTSNPKVSTVQAPTSVLIALAQLHLAANSLLNALEQERDNAHTDYRRLIVLPGGAGSDHTAMLLELASDREYHARKAIRVVNALALPQPEDLTYAAVVIA